MSATGWRALTVKQPWTWAICYAGKNVENRTWPIPPKRFCQTCEGTGEALFMLFDPIGGVTKTGMAVCPRCKGEPPPFRVMLHAGKQWDRDAITKNQYGGKFWTPPTMEMLTLLEWSPNPTHADPCECDEDEEHLDGKCAVLSAASLRLAFAPDPGAHCYNPIGMGTTKPWCPKCDDGWVGGVNGHHCDCDEEPDEDYDAWVHLGAVVAVVEFTGCHQADDPICAGSMAMSCSDWAADSGWHWEIGDVTVLDTPVPARGRQRFWIPDAETIEAVEAQL